MAEPLFERLCLLGSGLIGGSLARAARERGGIARLPGAHNGMAGLQARGAGFEGLYLSGAAMTASMGIPDLGMITVDEVCFFIRQVARASGLPVLVDGDTTIVEATSIVARKSSGPIPWTGTAVPTRTMRGSGRRSSRIEMSPPTLRSDAPKVTPLMSNAAPKSAAPVPAL